jgi:hypothetical protein
LPRVATGSLSAKVLSYNVATTLGERYGADRIGSRELLRDELQRLGMG